MQRTDGTIPCNALQEQIPYRRPASTFCKGRNNQYFRFWGLIVLLPLFDLPF